MAKLNPRRRREASASHGADLVDQVPDGLEGHQPSPKQSAASKVFARSLHATTRCSDLYSSRLSHTAPICRSIR